MSVGLRCLSRLVLICVDRCTQCHGSIYACSGHHDVCVAVCDKQRCTRCDHCDIWVSRPYCYRLLQMPIFLTDSISCGTYVSLCAMPAMSMGAVGDVGRRTGLFLSFAAFGALGGPPISGAINSATGGFEDVGWYAGKCSRVPFATPCLNDGAGGIVVLSVCLLFLTRYLHLGKLTGKF